MIILAFDTAMAACSAAIWRDGAILRHRRQQIDRGHSEILVPMIHDVMAGTATDFSDLDRIGVTVGPGSFTGIRIGIAAAHGFGLAASLPLVGVSTLEAVAEAAMSRNDERRNILVALDAGRPDLFVQVFGSDGTPLTQAQALSAEDIAALFPGETLLIAGNGTPRLRAVLADRDVVYDTGSGLPDAAYVAAIAGRRQPAPLSPLYIHPSYAKLPDTKPSGAKFSDENFGRRNPP